MTKFGNVDAITYFFDFRGDFIDDEDITEAIIDIGNPDANLPVTRTAETVEDFRKSGWQDQSRFDGNGIATVLQKGDTLAHIVDCGDHRLVWVD